MIRTKKVKKLTRKTLPKSIATEQLRKEMVKSAICYHKPVADSIKNMTIVQILEYCHPFDREHYLHRMKKLRLKK